MCYVFGFVVQVWTETRLTDEETVLVIVGQRVGRHGQVFRGQRIVVVYIMKVIRIFQVDLQDVSLGSISVHGIDVEIFWVIEETEVSHGKGFDSA